MRLTHHIKKVSFKVKKMNSPLKKIREKRNLKIVEVAEKVGVTPSNLGRIERGAQIPNRVLAEKLAVFFDGEISEMEILYPERFSAASQKEGAHVS